MEPRGHRRVEAGRQPHKSRDRDDFYQSAHQHRDQRYPPHPDARERHWARQDVYNQVYYSSPPPRQEYPPSSYSTLHPVHGSDRPEYSRPQSRHGYDYWDYRESSAYYDYYSGHYGHPDVAQWISQDTWKSDPYHQRPYEGEDPAYTEQYRYGQQRDSSQHQHSDYTDYPVRQNGDNLPSSHYQGNLESSKNSGLSSSGYELSQYMNEAENDTLPQSASCMAENENVPLIVPQADPLKYAIPHGVVSFGPAGQLIRVNPSFSTQDNPGLLEIHSLEVILGETQEQLEMRKFPGPLAREDLHKVDAIEFAHQRAAACMGDKTLKDRSSAALLWHLLILLCRQNGRMVGSDIAELIVQDSRSCGGCDADDRTLIDLSDGPTPETDLCQENTDLLTGNLTSDSPETSEQAVQMYTKLLLAGRKKEALESAMRTGLWGHALFLASKMDRRTYTTVLNRFTSQITASDPLQTLFQLLTGRIPAAAMCCGNDKWGDWKPHLAVMLSNETADPSVQQKAIITMGDTLASKGFLHAAHVCYLTACAPFGAFTRKAERLVLLASSHSQPFMEFATNSAIQCTELFEYCRTLGDKSFSIPSFQVYKFLYACRLLDCGLASQAFHYCEVVGKAILRQKEPSVVLTAEVIKLAERMSQSEGQLHGAGHDLWDPDWLKQLRHGLQALQMGRFDCTDSYQSLDTGSGKTHRSNTLYSEADIDDPRADVLSPQPELLYYRDPEEEDNLQHGQSSDPITNTSWDANAPQNWGHLASSPSLLNQEHIPPASLVAGSDAYSFQNTHGPQVQMAFSHLNLDGLPARAGGESSSGIGMTGAQVNAMHMIDSSQEGHSQQMLPQGETAEGKASEVADSQAKQSAKGGWFSGWFKSQSKDAQHVDSKDASPVATGQPSTPAFSTPPPPTMSSSSAYSAQPSCAGVNPFSRKAGQRLG